MAEKEASIGDREETLKFPQPSTLWPVSVIWSRETLQVITRKHPYRQREKGKSREKVRTCHDSEHQVMAVRIGMK